jgi:CcmD family protein
MKGLALRQLVVLLIVATIFLSSAAIPAMAQPFSGRAQQDTQGQATTTASSSDPEANLPYLFAVYAITWAIFFAYLYYLSQRQQNLRRELEELREALSEREGQGGGP